MIQGVDLLAGAVNIILMELNIRDGLLLAGRIKKRDPRTFHIGFRQESEERVNEINQRLRDDGFDVEPPQRQHAWTFYVQAPGGFTVEVLA
jgi:catechol 2,3-dioxygenase-like lactoylglutathione lyase family enzyme